MIATTSAFIAKLPTVSVMSTPVSSAKLSSSHAISTGEVSEPIKKYWREGSASSAASQRDLVITFEQFFKTVLPPLPGLSGVSHPAFCQPFRQECFSHSDSVMLTCQTSLAVSQLLLPLSSQPFRAIMAFPTVHLPQGFPTKGARTPWGCECPALQPGN